MRKYHYFYKITNNINNHFYYGVHNTDNLEDGYMGSGKRLHLAYKKYGIENFTKEILRFFDTSEEAFEYEAEIVNEKLVSDKNCYNMINGGKSGTTNMIVVKDKNNNHFTVLRDDPRYISGELVHHSKNIKIPYLKNKVLVRDNNYNYYWVISSDDRIKSGKLVPATKDKVLVKDTNGNYLLIDKNDPKYLSGEYCFIWKNKKHTEETKMKMSETHAKNKHQQGEKNSQFGTCWVHDNKKSIKIKKEHLEEYISSGWKKGRKINI